MFYFLDTFLIITIMGYVLNPHASALWSEWISWSKRMVTGIVEQLFSILSLKSDRNV